MPNWCDNIVKIEHKNKTAVDRVVKGFRAGKLCSEFAPIPDELLDTEYPNRSPKAGELLNKHGYSNWYDFCLEEWGTKWDIGLDEARCNVIDEQGDKFVYLTFSSAWAPPVALYEKLSRKGYHVTAYYYEPDGGFTGVYRSEAGDKYYMIPSTAEEVKQKIPQELDELFNILDQVQDEENALNDLMGGEE